MHGTQLSGPVIAEIGGSLFSQVFVLLGPSGLAWFRILTQAAK